VSIHRPACLSDLVRQRPLSAGRGETRCDTCRNRHARRFEAEDGRLETSARRLMRKRIRLLNSTRRGFSPRPLARAATRHPRAASGSLTRSSTTYATSRGRPRETRANASFEPHDARTSRDCNADALAPSTGMGRRHRGRGPRPCRERSAGRNARRGLLPERRLSPSIDEGACARLRTARSRGGLLFPLLALVALHRSSTCARFAA
jgi:hypothetical protein